MNKRNSINFRSVSGFSRCGKTKKQTEAGRFCLLGFLEVSKLEKWMLFHGEKIKKRGFETKSQRGVLGQKLKNGGFGGSCAASSFCFDLSPENRVIDNFYVKNTVKGLPSLITETPGWGF